MYTIVCTLAHTMNGIVHVKRVYKLHANFHGTHTRHRHQLVDVNITNVVPVCVYVCVVYAYDISFIILFASSCILICTYNFWSGNDGNQTTTFISK